MDRTTTTTLRAGTTPAHLDRTRSIRTAMLLGVIAAGVALRFAFDMGEGLWEDEVIAATHALQRFPSILVGILRQDIHPPIFFLQLHVWALMGHGDRWLVLDSVFWSLVGLASMWVTTRMREGAATATAATAFLAVLPSAFWMSHELRPYAVLCAGLIWAFHFVSRRFANDGRRTGDTAGVLVFCLGVEYTHAIGFLGTFFLGVYGLATLAGRRAPTREYVRWGAIFGALGLAATPVLASNMLHDANLASTRSLDGIATTLSTAITSADFGRGATFAIGIAAYVAIAVAGLAMPRTRAIAACMVILPLATTTALDLLVKPVFKPNFFSTLLTPFVALILANAALSAAPRRRTAIMAAMLACVAAFAAETWTHRWPITGYRETADRLRPALRAGDVVYAPQLSMFWGMARYLDGPDWGDPLAVTNPPSPQWRRLYDRLGPSVVAATGLEPTTQSIPGPNGSTLLVGEDSLPQAARFERVWLVTTPRADLPDGFPPDRIGAMARGTSYRVHNLTVTLYRSCG